MRLPAIRWFLSLPAAMFYCLTASALHAMLDSPLGFPALVALLAEILLPSSIALWVLADARRRHRALPYDFGSFIFLAWPVLVPIYLFHTRSWRAFAPLGFFVLLYIASVAASILTWFLSSRQ